MKGRILFAALAGLVLASCTNNEQLLDETKKGREIRFAVAPQTAQTRAEHDIDVPYDERIKIWAWTKNASAADGDIYEDLLLIDGDLYDPTGKTFASGKQYYYPRNGKSVTFYAVPENALKDNTNPSGYFTAPNVETVDGKEILKSTFTTPDNIVHHGIDLMSTEFITQKEGTVPLILRHLFAKINVRVQQIGIYQSNVSHSIITLKSLKIAGIKKEGTVNIDDAWTAANDENNKADRLWDTVDGNGTWTIVSEGEPYDLVIPVTSTEEPTTSTLTTHNLESESHFVLPQRLDNNQKIVISYTITTNYTNQPQVVEEFENEIALKTAFTNIEHWAMNKNITYIININPIKETQKITFDVDVEEWGAMTGSNSVAHGNRTIE